MTTSETIARGLDAAAARLRVAVPSVADRVAAELRHQLAEGLLPPGTRLTELTIAEDLGVSRNTVREAFAELAAERLVVRHPNRGVFVASLAAGDIHDVYTVRRAIEVSAIRGGGSPERVAAVRAAVEEGKAAAAANDDEGAGQRQPAFPRRHRGPGRKPAAGHHHVPGPGGNAALLPQGHRGSGLLPRLPDGQRGDLRRPGSRRTGPRGELLLAYLDRSEEKQAAVHGE